MPGPLNANGRWKLVASVAAAVLLMVGSATGSAIYKVFASHEERLAELEETQATATEWLRHVEVSLARIEQRLIEGGS
jgi:hypothetical protein